MKDTEFEIYHSDLLTNDCDMLRETNPAKMPKLDALDALIAARSRKLDGLRAQKRGLMQQLFPNPQKSVSSCRAAGRGRKESPLSPRPRYSGDRAAYKALDGEGLRKKMTFALSAISHKLCVDIRSGQHGGHAVSVSQRSRIKNPVSTLSSGR